jgi:TonB-dependent receptor
VITQHADGNLTLRFHQTPLTDAFDLLASKSAYRLSYSSAVVSSERTITLRMVDVSPEEALRQLLNRAELDYRRTQSGQLVLVPEPSEPQYGRLRGTVLSDDADEPLPGVNLRLAQADQTVYGTSTDRDGAYAFNRIAAGTYTLTASYIGYETIQQDVTIRANETVTLDLTMSVQPIVGEEVVVLGYRAQTQAKALNQQKNAVNVQNVIASDRIGRFPDATVPSSLQRVPGINIQRDQGEARYVQIRGGSAGMTQVSFNGANIPSPEGEERQIALDAIPTELVDAIEVNKAITPDMEAEATGGGVNLITRRPPPQRTLTVQGSTGYGDLRDEVTGKGAITYGDQFGQFGVLLSGSFNHRRFGSDGLEAEYDLSENPSEDAVAEMEQRIYDITRQRTGATAFFDYSFNPDSRLFLNGVFTELLDDEYQPNLISIPEDEALEFEIAPRVETARTFSVSGGGEHQLGSVSLDYKAGWIHSEEDTPTENTLLFLREGVSFNPSVEGPRTNPSTVDGLLFDEYESEEKTVNNTDVYAQVDLNIPYTLGAMNGTMQFGGKIRNKNADQSVEIFAYGLRDGADDIALSDIGSSFGVDGYEPGSYTFPTRALGAGAVNDFNERFADRLEREKDVEGDTEDYDILERTTAGYVMTELNVTDRLLLLPGVRYEYTTLESEGFAFDAETEALTPTSGDTNYGLLFPMLNARYRIGNNTNIRAAVTRTLERPNYFFSVPFSIRDEGEVERGNPELDPMTSINYDLMVEHYSSSVGVLSAGAFAKQLTDPIFTSVSVQDDGTTVLQPRNASSGHILGFELNLQRQLLFLPSPLDGFDITANYTYTDSEATLNSGRETRLPGQTDMNWNLALGYEKYGFSARVSLNASGDYIEELGDPLETFYVDNHFQVDLMASYQFTPQLSTTLEMVNLNNEPFVRYQGRSSRPAQQEFYRTWGRLSLQYDL